MSQEDSEEQISPGYEEVPPKAAMVPSEGEKTNVVVPLPDLGIEVGKEAASRRTIGWSLGCVGLLVVVIIICAAFWALHGIASRIPDSAPYLIMVAMVAHAIISLGAIWFGYQMLRAAERMFVPQRLLKGGDSKTDVELVRALTGISAPTTAALEQGLKMTGDLIKTVGEATKSVKDRGE
jgi:hypothetical protein